VIDYLWKGSFYRSTYILYVNSDVSGWIEYFFTPLLLPDQHQVLFPTIAASASLKLCFHHASYACTFENEYTLGFDG